MSGDSAASGVPHWRARVDLKSLFLTTRGDPVVAVRDMDQRGFVAPGRDDLDPWPLPVPLQWDADPFEDLNWQFQLHAWRVIDEQLLAHGETLSLIHI